MNIINFLINIKENVEAEELYWENTPQLGVNYLTVGCSDCQISTTFVCGEYKNFSPQIKVVLNSIVELIQNKKKPPLYSCDSHFQYSDTLIVVVHNLDGDIDVANLSLICQCKLPLWSKIYGFEDDIIRIIHNNCKCNKSTSTAETDYII